MPESRFTPTDIDRILVQGSYEVDATRARYLIIVMPNDMTAVRNKKTRTVRVEGVARQRGGVTMVAHATGNNARIMQSGGDMIIGGDGKVKGQSTVRILLPDGYMPDIESI